MSASYKIHKIFSSIQGEGGNAGIPMLFVCFSGCNLKCTWCDTNHAIGAEMSQEELLQRISRSNARWVCFTGGEPALQLNTELTGFCSLLHRKVAVETNGTKWNDTFQYAHYVTISPKPEAPIAQEWEARRQVDELRLIMFPNGNIIHPGFIRIQARHVCISPLWDKKRNAPNKKALHYAVKYVKRHPFCRLSVQLHKLLEIR